MLALANIEALAQNEKGDKGKYIPTEITVTYNKGTADEYTCTYTKCPDGDTDCTPTKCP